MRYLFYVFMTLVMSIGLAQADNQTCGLGAACNQQNPSASASAQGGQGGNVSNSGNSANWNYNDNTAIAGSTAGAAAGAGAWSGGNTQGVSVDASTKVDAAPAPSPHIALTSNGCIGSVSGSGTAPVVGIGVGITRDHDDCFKLEMAKFYQARGDGVMADIMLTSTAWYKSAMKDHEEAKAKKAEADAAKRTAFYQKNGYPVTTIFHGDGTSESVSWQTPRQGGLTIASLPE